MSASTYTWTWPADSDRRASPGNPTAAPSSPSHTAARSTASAQTQGAHPRHPARTTGRLRTASDLFASDVGLGGAGASAEDTTMHVIPPP
ncbi:DUF5709 domain-containing protein [Streptomyces nigra]|uniref:DUF5709 domain-containing protein n=1 Tax=Streptomyces nigra TaxID=1827580 RepID=UPI00371C674C